MDRSTVQRGQMAAIGALAGLSFYGLWDMVDRGIVGDRSFLVLVTFALTFFTGLLALAGPLAILRSSLSALVLAIVTAGLVVWASFRFDNVDNYFDTPFAIMAATVVGSVPLPFVVAASGPGWRDYPALFSAAWTIVVRYAAAWVFVGIVWGMIYLSDTLLSIVGLRVIQTLIDITMVPFLVTGLTLGLALAVVQEMKDYVSPFLILRLLRLLLPVVLVVMVVFVGALPVQGLSGLFGGLSVAATLLAMTAAAATLITTAIDQSDADATQSPFLATATQALALILPIPAGLAAYAVWLRVDQYGWTPDRFFAATMAALGIGYGLVYASAVVLRSEWMARIRQGNIGMALIGTAAAGLWLTPILNAERLSANNLVSRYEAGKTPIASLDINQLKEWGIAGSAALDALGALAKDPGQTALAAALATATDPIQADADPATVLSDLTEILPLQPATATEDRNRLLATQQPYDLASWLTACKTPLPDGKPGCVMMIADFNPLIAGNEAIMVFRDIGDSMRYVALITINGVTEQRSVAALEGSLPYDATGTGLIAQMQMTAPNLSPAPLNQALVGSTGLTILP